jgi:uncharacterized protein (TIGR03083 family)
VSPLLASLLVCVSVEPRRVYDDSRARIVALAGDLAPGALSQRVPGTPAWSVHDLMAHLVGVAADVQSGHLEGAGSEDWTARQVAQRRGASLDELLREWDKTAPAVQSVLDGAGAFHPFAADIFTHEHDLRGALGDGELADQQVARDLVGTAVSAALGRRLDELDRPALRVVGESTEWVAGGGEVGAAVRAPTSELLRSLFGRRSERQVRGYAWDGDPSPFLDAFNVFGPLPLVDVAEAGAP